MICTVLPAHKDTVQKTLISGTMQTNAPIICINHMLICVCSLLIHKSACVVYLLLVNLLLRAHWHSWLGDGVSGGLSLPVRVEVRVHKMAVALHVGQRLPHHIALGQEALVGDQQEQLSLKTHAQYTTVQECATTQPPPH